MRRGDLSTASAAREMPAGYYIAVVKNLIQVRGAHNVARLMAALVVLL
jgi:hypothetical protein